MIINGQAEMVGSDRQGVRDAIARQAALDQQLSVPVAVASRERELVVEVAGVPDERLRIEATVWIVTVVPRVEIEIRRGENAGRTVAYTNVVRKIIPAGMWHGDNVDLSQGQFPVSRQAA
jgi:hypothetical protein